MKIKLLHQNHLREVTLVGENTSIAQKIKTKLAAAEISAIRLVIKPAIEDGEKTPAVP